MKVFIFILFCQHWCVDSTYSWNITCVPKIPFHIPFDDLAQNTINETLRNISRLTSLERGLNQTELCDIAKNMITSALGLRPREKRSADQPPLPSDDLSLMSTRAPQTLPEPWLFPPAQDNRNLNQTGSNTTINGKKTRIILPGAGVFPLSSKAKPFKPPPDVMPLPGLVFAYTLQLLVNNAYKQRIEECGNRNGFYDDQHGICRFNNSAQNSIKRVLKHLINPRIAYYINLVGNIFSIICLTALLIIFGVFNTLRTRPGKNIMCLSVAMNIVQVLQLVGIHVLNLTNICTAVGILLHWAYLLTFFWMAIISFDLFITFAFPFKSGKFGRSNQFRIYNCVALGIATITVLVCVILDFAANRLVGYGAQVCFIGSVWGNFFSFILVVGLVMVFNLICLIATIYKVYIAQKRSRQMKTDDGGTAQDRLRLCLMALKISTLTALGWIFGFLGGLLSNRALIYIFLIVTAFQGVLVFLAFCCNKRVYLTVTGKVEDGTTWTSKEKRTLLTSTGSKAENGVDTYSYRQTSAM